MLTGCIPMTLESKPMRICLSQAPYSFDLSVMDLYPTLTAGGKLAVLPKKTTDNFKELFEVIYRNFTFNEVVSTPSLMDICLLQPTFNEKHMPELTHFLFCGEELTHSTASQLKETVPACPNLQYVWSN